MRGEQWRGKEESERQKRRRREEMTKEARTGWRSEREE